MSAYLVADETINRVVEWLYWELDKSPWLREKLEKASGISTSNYAWSEELGKAMFALNIAGVTDRYGDEAAAKFRTLNYHYQPAHGSAVQVLKSLQCWLYKCTEREVGKQPLYRFFHDVVEPHLMSSIISDLSLFCQIEFEARNIVMVSGCHETDERSSRRFFLHLPLLTPPNLTEEGYTLSR